MTDDERLGPPPVEPMSDVAWSRIERGLWLRIDAAGTTAGFDRAPPTPRRWWITAAPIVAAAAIVAIVIGTRTGTQELAPIDEPARVVSGSASSSVSFGDAHVELDADSAVVMSHENGQPIVLLERGAAWFTVAPRMQRPEFVVRAGDATVRVVGTRFHVARSRERIAVDVDHGLVDVRFRGGAVAVGANQHWSSDAPSSISAAAGTPPPIAPVASSESATSKPRSDPKPDAKADPKLDGTHATDVDRARAEYDRLAALEPKAPLTALNGYLSLAQGTSRWADLALFAAARLAVDQQDSRAKTLLFRYLQRFPNGANTTDAKQLLDRLKSDRL
jgi:transmembrane sensor